MSGEDTRLPLMYVPIKERHLCKLKLLNSAIFHTNLQVGALHYAVKDYAVKCSQLVSGC